MRSSGHQPADNRLHPACPPTPEGFGAYGFDIGLLSQAFYHNAGGKYQGCQRGALNSPVGRLHCTNPFGILSKAKL
jgi:hypothetical protein